MAELHFADAPRLSHAYILAAPQRSEAVSAARRLAAAAVCSSTGARPCGTCRDCRKAYEGIHPDVISVRRLTDDKGRVKKEMTVDQVREMAADSVVLPNEAACKAYIIEDADLMNVQAQSAALKLLEEPPAGVMFILCAENAQLLLPTVRSRCVQRNVGTAAGGESGESAALAPEYFRAAASGSASRLCAFCFANEGLDVRAASDFIDSAIELAGDMLCARRDDLGLGRGQLMRLYALLRRCEAYLKVNTGVKHIFGLLAVDSLPCGSADRKDR